MVSIKNLHKAYRTKKVLHGVELELVKGKVCGIVGENGAGKTTLFKCIAGLIDFEGTITSDWKPLKNHLGFLPTCLLYTSPSPRDATLSRMPSSA